MDKIVILAAGLGKRMREHDDGAQLSADQVAAAETGVKALIPIGRPFLDYVLTRVADAGFCRVCLIIGPEGGFDPEERQLMKKHGVNPVNMGPRILRTETAGIAALAAIGVLWGDL